MELFRLIGKIIIDNSETKKKTDETTKEVSKLSKVFGGLGKGAAVAGKAIGAGLVAGATAVTGLVTQSIQSFAEYEQLVGGVDTLFKDASAKVQGYAANAYKTAGMSANEYMNTVTSFSASLLQSLDGDTTAAAEKANLAITDMSDNANKMGTDMGMIQNAYQGFAKQNYTMLDNLKLGYGGTKEEMSRLLEDAEKLSGVKYDISSYADIVDAIHVVQTEMGITGTTAQEAASTISGSMSSMKGAWQNLLTSMSADDLPFGEYVDTFVDSVSTVVSNVMPRIQKALGGCVDLINQLAPIIIGAVPKLLNELLPSVVSAATGMIDAIVAALPGVVDAVLNALPMLIDGVMQVVDGLIGALPTIMQALVTALPTLIPQLIDAVVNLIMMLVEMLPQIIDPLIAALPTIIISIVDALVNNLPVLIQGFMQLMMGIVTAIPQIIQALVEAIPTVVSLLVQAVLENLPAIIVGLVQVVVGIVAALPQILGSLISAIPAALSGVWNGIKNVFSGLGSWFSEKFSGAKEAAVNAWSNAKEKWNGIKEKCVEGFNNFKEKVGTKFSEAKEAAQQKWSDAKTKWSAVKDKVVDGFSNLKDKVKTKFTEAKTNAQNAWSDAKSKFSSVKDKVVSAFSDLGGKLSPLFSKAKDNATQTWSNLKSIFNKFKTGDIVGAFSDLGSLLKGKFSSALNVAKKGFDKIKQIGKDLVSGLWNGIGDKFSWLTGKIKGFAKNVTDKLKGFFGIKSPSRVMRDEVGKQLADGVAVGITANTKNVESASEKMSKNVLDAAKKRLEDYKVYNELSLADEVAYWDSVRQQITEGTDARIEADKQYLEAKKSLDEQLVAADEKLQTSLADAGQTLESSLAEAAKELQATLDEIYADIEQRAKDIIGSFDLFSEFEIDERIDPMTMYKGLDSQIEILEGYDEIMSSLKEKIGGTALYEELKALGVDAISKIDVLNDMTDMQLKMYVEKYERRNELAYEIADKELKDKTQAAIDAANALYDEKVQEANLKFFETAGKAYKDFSTTCAEVGVEITTETEAMKLNVENAFAGMSTAVTEAVETFKTVFENFEPKMKMPHFKIEGVFDLQNGIVPSVGVEWFKKAMNNAMVLDKPTIFGYNATNGNLLGAGEAGSEVVAGSSTLMNMIQAAVSEQNSSLLSVLTKILQAILGMDSNMGGHLRDALENTALEINNREFARLVKAVKA